MCIHRWAARDERVRDGGKNAVVVTVMVCQRCGHRLAQTYPPNSGAGRRQDGKVRRLAAAEAVQRRLAVKLPAQGADTGVQLLPIRV